MSKPFMVFLILSFLSVLLLLLLGVLDSRIVSLFALLPTAIRLLILRAAKQFPTRHNKETVIY